MRERVGTFMRSDGQKFTVHMLKVCDIRDVDIMATDMRLKLAARSIGLTDREFDQWDIADALRLALMFEHAVNVLGKG